jgi:glycosyltransferase involved in cell wall biosynthesis
LISQLRKITQAREKIVILSDHTYLPDRVGGRESSIHELATNLLTVGFKPIVIAKKSKSPRKFPLFTRARHLPAYEIRRVADPVEEVGKFTKSFPRSKVIANLDNKNIPAFLDRYHSEAFVYYRDLQNVSNISGRSDLARLRFIANSDYVAAGVQEALDLRPIVVPPFIRAEGKQDGASRGHAVTFVNPIPKKGLEIAIGVAKRLPDIPFLFLESWPLGDKEWKDLVEICRPYRNVTLQRSVLSMNPVYAKTRILLAPSQWVEAWGRVVTEAQFRGIPAVTSDTGGLPGAVGRGGIVLPRDAPIQEWEGIVRGMYEDRDRWGDLSVQAMQQSRSYVEYRDKQYSALHAVLADSR